MIKANDLRIGNYVMDRVSGEWMVTTKTGKSIGATVINRDKDPLPDGWEMVGIELTPEIWKKLGFEQMRPSCTYLHEFQNHFREITGEELRINIKDFVTIK